MSLQALAEASVHQERFIRSFHRHLRDFRRSSRRGTGKRSYALGLHRLFLNPAARTNALPERQREIDLGWVGADLHLFTCVFKAEHVYFDNPRPRRHAVKVKSSAVVRQGHQDAVALGSLDGGALNRLTFGFHHSGLGQTRGTIDRERDHRDQKITHDTTNVLHVMVADPVLRLQPSPAPAGSPATSSLK